MAKKAQSPEDKARALYQQAMQMYAPGGGFTKGLEASLARQQQKSVAQGMQSLAAAGLGSTSMIGGLGRRFQEEVAVPALAQAESTRAQRMADVLMQQAQFEASRPEVTHTTLLPQSMFQRSPGSVFNQQPQQTQQLQQPQRNAMELPQFQFRGPRSQATPQPAQFTEAFIGDPNVTSATGKTIGKGRTGTYDLGTGRLTQAYAPAMQAAASTLAAPMSERAASPFRLHNLYDLSRTIASMENK